MRKWEHDKFKLVELEARNNKAQKLEKALRQSIRPNTDDLPLIDTSSDEESEIIPTLRCDRCTHVLHKND